MDSLAHYISIGRSVYVRYFAHTSRFKLEVVATVLILLGGYLYLLTPPADFSPNSIVRITPGSSVPKIAQTLADAHIIAHPTLLRAVLRVTGRSSAVQTGVYKFETPPNLFTVVYRLVAGDYGLPSVRITFVEGVTVREAALQVESAFPEISASEFRAAALGQEGYLFPDTYFFGPEVDAQMIVARMRTNFDEKVPPFVGEAEVITLASLVEKEARTTENRHIVAGILMNRLARKMPLQVDAVFGYIFNRDTYSPSFSDLKVDSPYNLYTHTGLPPGPIDNPGLDAIEAARHPTKTKYLYYLTGRDNQMHYATTYAAHLANQKKYLP